MGPSRSTKFPSLVELGRLQRNVPIDEWMRGALRAPIRLLPLTPEIAVESTQLPPPFHRDPADQLIVATARVHGCPLVTTDRANLAYSTSEHRPVSLVLDAAMVI